MRAPPRGTVVLDVGRANTKLANAGSRAATFPARPIEAPTPSRPLAAAQPRPHTDRTLLAYRDAWLMRAANVAPAASVI